MDVKERDKRLRQISADIRAKYSKSATNKRICHEEKKSKDSKIPSQPLLCLKNSSSARSNTLSQIQREREAFRKIRESNDHCFRSTGLTRCELVEVIADVLMDEVMSSVGGELEQITEDCSNAIAKML
eukprot:TRINITY_DN780231_c0_g1_i1.p1 TRINITY_DN780231_c0_g1~~TRINITY_DN780231_c0_g1_i1.p1  ORF type:complete len:128 (+),score=18.90 TRINITY_DN780231_c0_g1_i1:63-446(+)